MVKENLFIMVDCEDYDEIYGIIHCSGNVNWEDFQTEVDRIKSSGELPEDWNVGDVICRLPEDWNAWVDDYDGIIGI